jgi:transposase-like protein
MTKIKGQSGRRHPGNGNYKRVFIDEVVKSIEDGMLASEAGRHFKVPLTTILSWMTNYGSPEYHKRNKPVSAGFKRKVLHAIAGGMTVKEAMIAYNIKSEGAIRSWKRQAKQENAELVSGTDNMADKKQQQDQNPGTTAEVKALQAALREAELKIAALNTLIDVAEEQLKINIRKKPGAKQ